MPADGAELGRGHFGTVRIGTKIATGEEFAVKTILKATVRSPDMLRNEIAIMKTLNHPSIVRLVGEYEDELHVHLVMELCTGGELFDRISAIGRYQEKPAAQIMKTVLSAVRHCHENNIVHRDLKPENFLLTSTEPTAELKVIDFGLSKFTKPGEWMDARVGTPYYMAPEVLTKRYDHRIDLWSCGVVLYILLCGYPPFWGDRDSEIFSKIRRGQYSFEGPEWATVSDGAKDLVSKLLVLDPAYRLTADGALKHPWMKAAYLLHPDIVSSLRRFAVYRQIKQLSLNVIARTLTDDEVEDLKEAFEDLDKDCVGVLSVSVLRHAMQFNGADPSRREMLALFAHLDINGDGWVDFFEFVAATMRPELYLQPDRLHAAFRELDVDKNGIIDLGDLRSVVGTGHGRAREILAEADTDQDSRVDYEEFLRAMCGS